MTTLCRFRPAVASDDHWLTPRLPSDRSRGVCFVGHLPDRLLPVAAFAVSPPIERFEPQGLGVALHIEPDVEPWEIARHVVELAEKMAAASGLGPLHAWPDPTAESSAAKRYESLGFVAFDRIETWEAPTQAADAFLRPLLQQARAGSPQHAVWQAVDRPLAGIDAEAVLKLYAAELADPGGLTETFRANLRGEVRSGLDPQRSRVLLLEDKVIAFALVRLIGPVRWVQALVVAPPYRDGLAELRLLTSLTDYEPPAADTRVRFETHDRHRHTRRLAPKLGAQRIATRLKLRKTLPAAPPHALPR